MTTKLGQALREKFSDPREALRAMGLDESLIGAQETSKMSKPTRLAHLALELTASAVGPILAKDAKINLMPIFKDVTTKNFKAGKVMMALDAALKGKTAKDADPAVHLGHLKTLLEHIEHTAGEPESLDKSVSEAQHNAMGAAAGGHSNLGIPQETGKEFMRADAGHDNDPHANLGKYLAGKGMSEDDIRGALDLLPHIEEKKEEGLDEEEVGEKDWGEKPAEDAEESEGERESDLKSEEAGAREHEHGEHAEDRRRADDKLPRRMGKDRGRADDKRRADDKKTADDRRGADDKFPKHALDSKDMVTKQAMDAAIEAATKATVERLRAIDVARQDIRPYVGDLKMAFDSAEDVYAAALKARNFDVKGVHSSAYKKILTLLPKAGAREVETGSTSMAMDEERKENFFKRFPGAERIEQA